jgi:nucleolar protein 56
MRAFLITTPIGVFGIAEDKKIIHFEPFSKNPEEIAEKLKLAENEILDEEKKVQEELKKEGYEEVYFSVKKPGVKNFELNSKAEQFVKENLRKLALDYNFVKDQIEFNQLLTKINIELTKTKIKKAIEKDSVAIQLIRIIEDIDKMTNVLMERLREFYSLHFPEMDRLVQDHREYAKIVEKYGLREKIEELELKQIAQKSMGADFGEEEIKTIQTIASRILEFYKLRDNLSKQLEKILKEVAPNFTELAGPMLSAKLIAKAGGLEKLAKMPSSAIQLMGAEKSLFRFLHGKGKSPRFGLIYNHPFVLNAPEKFKGKVARILASKLSIAAKLDFYSKEYKGDELKKELEEKVKKALSSKS